MLESNGPAPEFAKEVGDNARIKLDNFVSYQKAPDFTRDEEIFLLYNPDILREAALMMNLA